MESSEAQNRTNLFLLRLWSEANDASSRNRTGERDGRAAVCHGRILDIQTGEGHNFSSLSGLLHLLERTLPPASQRDAE